MAGETNFKGEVSVEMEALKADVSKLSNDLREMLHTVGTQGKEKLIENKKRLESALKTLKGQAQEKFEDAREYICEHGQEAMEKSRKQIKEKPLTAVGIAFGVGILLGALLRRR
jgi:ElaB/YqjD/DUF883 family membrane-anchored ribosome-binding protein